jgi:imidazolonepropionase-like amidohydrolase
LLSGTDPLRGDLIAGFSNHLQVELLVQAGFSPLDAIKVSSLNGAIFLDREDEIGSIEEGKKADLFIVTGDPSTNISDIRNVEFVFKSGVGYDSEKLIKSCEGLVGIR